MKDLVTVTNTLNSKVRNLKFSEPVTHVYNPLDYAYDLVEQYLTKYGEGKKEVFFLGMNPGPFGMAQTGIPFGEIAAVKSWLKLNGKIEKPADEHPERPILGFDCHRSEVSGKRIWGLFEKKFKTPEKFFSKNFVWNFCPLLFSEIHRHTGKKVCRNLTPDKIKSPETVKLYQACDQALKDFIDILDPENLVGVGAFAETCLKRIFPDRKDDIYRMLHPSPASPVANKDFEGISLSQMKGFGIWKG